MYQKSDFTKHTKEEEGRRGGQDGVTCAWGRDVLCRVINNEAPVSLGVTFVYSSRGTPSSPKPKEHAADDEQSP